MSNCFCISRVNKTLEKKEWSWIKISGRQSKDVETDDSPVKSVWRDALVDELPFSSKVHWAVQLWRDQSKERKSSVLFPRWMPVSTVHRPIIRPAELKGLRWRVSLRHGRIIPGWRSVWSYKTLSVKRWTAVIITKRPFKLTYCHRYRHLYSPRPLQIRSIAFDKALHGDNKWKLK